MVALPVLANRSAPKWTIVWASPPTVSSEAEANTSARSDLFGGSPVPTRQWSTLLTSVDWVPMKMSSVAELTGS